MNLNEESKIKFSADLRFPRGDSNQIAVHECRVFDKGGRVKDIIPAKSTAEVVAQPLRHFGWGDGISL